MHNHRIPMKNRLLLFGAKNINTSILIIYLFCYLSFLTIDPILCMDTPPEPSSGGATLKLFGFEYNFSWKPTPETVANNNANNVEKMCKETINAYKEMGQEPPKDYTDWCNRKVLEARKVAIRAQSPEK